MISVLLRFLASRFHLKIPAVFYYSSTRMVMAAITTLLFVVCFGGRMIRILYKLKTGRSLRVEGCPQLAELHSKKKETPTMGGVLILTSMLVSACLWNDFTKSFPWVLCLATVWLGTIGGADDYLKMKYKNAKGISPRTKLFFQVFFAALFGFYFLFVSPEKRHVKSHVAHTTYKVKEELSAPRPGTYYLPFKKRPFVTLRGAGLGVAFLFTLFVVTGASNAVNLTDGLDGLAAGLVLPVAFVLAIFAFLMNHVELARYLHLPYIAGSGEIGIYLAGLCGACLGFLWYNDHPAEVFMGDTGSLALGGVLGVSSVLLRSEFLLALVGAIFVMEALSVILQVFSYRFRYKKRIFRCAPLHHHFEFEGWPETRVVARFRTVGLILALIGLASVKFR
ncbi:MAG: phospho-N-acetylmuramoyl-pentapeptide-transferase [Simkaniaceae bacterium]|nr:phospho-N-acetylmuramoyl-pentapeptide-transferase [Simkaniaceae bacterium]